MSKKFLQEVERGRQGLNIGLPNCFDKFNDHIYGTQKDTYYLIGGEPGTGKSTFTDDNFILTPYFFFKNQGLKIPIKWFYYSLEIGEIAKRAKWTAWKLYEDYRIVTDSAYILSKNSKNRISDEIYNRVIYVDQQMDELFDHIVFNEDNQNPTGIYSDIRTYAEKNGTTEYEEFTDHSGVKGRKRVGYIPNDPNEAVEIIVDHVGLTKKERGYNNKENIDKLSEYLVDVRRVYRYIPIVVSQLHRGLSNIERMKFAKQGGVDLSPTIDDFKETGNLGQDASTAMIIFDPVKHNIKSYAGYDLTQLQDTFRSVHLVKQRDAISNLVKPMYFQGGIGKLSELPDSNLFESGIVDYKNYQ